MTTTTRPTLRTQALAALTVMEGAHVAGLPEPASVRIDGFDGLDVSLDSLADLIEWATRLDAPITRTTHVYEGQANVHHRAEAEWYEVPLRLVALVRAAS